MPGTSKESAQVEEHGPVTDRHAELDGYTVSFVSFAAEIDGTEMLKGLPDDHCQCPHWGYVLEGELTWRYGDREETFKEGDAFYAPPGHIPLHAAGSELLLFSPTDELRETEEVMMKNMERLQGGPK